MVWALKLGVVCRIMAPKDIHTISKPVSMLAALAKGTCMQLSHGAVDGEMHYLAGPNIIARVLIREKWRQEAQVREGDVVIKTEVGVMQGKDAWKPSSLWKLEKAKKNGFFPPSLQKERSPANPF